MIPAFQIPWVPVEQFSRHDTWPAINSVFERLSTVFGHVALREPAPEDDHRWHVHEIAGRTHRLARPLTLTPYASARACSARCRFCSETLRDDRSTGPMSASLRPGPTYFSSLRTVLQSLRGVPLSYALSGREATDDPDWLLALLDALTSAATTGPTVEGAVMYTNGAGLPEHGSRLLPALQSFGLSWIEWSRHHDQGDVNDRIMRFRRGQRIADQHVFTDAIAARQATASA